MVMPLWMYMILSPMILWLIISPFIGSRLIWNFIISNTADDVDKLDKKRAIKSTWLTASLTNIISSLILLIIEFIMRMAVDTMHFSSLTIWDSPLTVIVYTIPIIISFFIIWSQVRRRASCLLVDRGPSKVASWIMAILYSPWYIIIPSSAIWNLTEIVK